MVYYNSSVEALKKFNEILLNPYENMELLDAKKAEFWLSITPNAQFNLFFKKLITDTNLQLRNNNICIWQKNHKEDSLIDDTLDFCDLSDEIIPNDIMFEINKNNYKVLTLKNNNTKKLLIS